MMLPWSVGYEALSGIGWPRLLGTLWFAIRHYAVIGTFAILAYLYGRCLTRRITYRCAVERIGISTTIGIGVFIYWVFFLGMLGWLYRGVLLTGLLVFAGASLCLLRTEKWDRPVTHRRWLDALRSVCTVRRLAIVCVLLLVTLPIWIFPLYPPTVWDATEYHLACAKIYAQQHRIILTPYLRFPVLPQAVNMLFTMSLLLWDDIVAHLSQFLMVGLIALILWLFRV